MENKFVQLALPQKLFLLIVPFNGFGICAENATCNFLVIVPRLPLPISRPSITVTGITSAVVDV